MVHNPKHKVHSFRGLLPDEGQYEINLERQNMNVAYRIVKFDLISNEPGGDETESVVQIWRERDPADTSRIDFSLPDLLAAGIFISQLSVNYTYSKHIIFDNILFSKNIFVTHADNNGSAAINYYLEIEEVPVGAATLMQLKLGLARKLNLKQDPEPT